MTLWDGMDELLPLANRPVTHQKQIGGDVDEPRPFV